MASIRVEIINNVKATEVREKNEVTEKILHAVVMQYKPIPF
jgi:hypothetical protein